MRYLNIFLAQGGVGGFEKNFPQIQMPEERGDVEALIWLVHNIGIVLKFYTLIYLFGIRCAPITLVDLRVPILKYKKSLWNLYLLYLYLKKWNKEVPEPSDIKCWISISALLL